MKKEPGWSGKTYRGGRVSSEALEASDREALAEYIEEGCNYSRLARRRGTSVEQARRKVIGAQKRLARLANPLLNPQPGRESEAQKLQALVDTMNLDVSSSVKITSGKIGRWDYTQKDPKTGLPLQVESTKAEMTIKALDAVMLPRPSPLRAYEPIGVAPSSDEERIFIIGDLQIGYWCVVDDDNPKLMHWVPFHDERAIDIMMQALAVYRPTLVVVIGDALDFPQLSRFRQEPEWAQTLRASIAEFRDLLRKVRLTVGQDCKIVFIPGNHETRLAKAIVENLPAFHKMKLPGAPYPVYSVAALCEFDKVGVELMAEYPSGEYWYCGRKGMQPGLVFTHEKPRRKDMRADAVFGHDVLADLNTYGVFDEHGMVTYIRMCVSGCGNYLDRSDRFGVTITHTPSGRSRMESSQSFGTITIDKPSGVREYGLHIMRDHQVRFLGRIITPAIPNDNAA